MTGRRWRVEKRQTIWGIMPAAWHVIDPRGDVIDVFRDFPRAIWFAHLYARQEQS